MQNPQADAASESGDAGQPAPDAASESGDAGQPVADAGSVVDTFGPAGRWPSHTPAYDTAADVVTSSLNELQSEIDSASSGTVIEHQGHLDSSRLTGGSTQWSDNVLVRPPLGQRAEYEVRGRFFLQADRVTMAGFANAGNMRIQSCNRCGWAWIENIGAGPSAIVTAQDEDAVEPFIYEWVSTEVGIGGDRMQFKSSGARLVRPQFIGLYLTGKTREVGAGDHNDTMQTFQLNGGSTEDALISHSVLFSSGDKALQGDGTSILYDHVLVYEPNPSGMWAPWPSGTDGAYGYHAITGGLSNSEIRGGSIIVGSFGSTLDTMRNSTIYSSSDDPLGNVENAIDVTVEMGNPEPPKLPSEMTHEHLDSLWAE
jgi:hypothetical protein